MDSTKMSKSLGNVLLVHDMVKKTPGEVIRLALLSAHYRQPLDWTDDTLESSRRMLDRLYGAVRGTNVAAEQRIRTTPPASVIAALEDDLNTPQAIAELFDVAKRINKCTNADERVELAAELLAAGDLVGLLQQDPEEWFAGSRDGDISAEEIEQLLREREQARASRDFAQADRIRDQLGDAGITIEDGASGTRWRRGA